MRRLEEPREPSSQEGGQAPPAAKPQETPPTLRLKPPLPLGTIRSATAADSAGLERLVSLSARRLLGRYYSAAQIESALGPVFGLDRQIIADGGYFVVEEGGRLVGCGGWSQRRAVFGGDRDRAGENGLIDPTREPARIRAFFVHPDFARRGIGGALLEACERALREAGFRGATLVATLAGEPLYASRGYQVEERYDVPLRDGLLFPVVRMAKQFEPPG